MGKIDFFALGLKPNYTFDQLVVGANNQMAAAASLQVSKNLGESYNPLFLYGPSGVGKTHMMQAIAHASLKMNSDLKVKYISAERFVNEVISAISEDNVVAVRQHYSQLDMLMLDDVQYLLESKSTQSEFLHIFNNLHQQNKQVILASDRSPMQLTAFDKTIRSRFEWGLAADIKIPDLVTRMEILNLKQKNYGLTLSEEAMRYVGELLRSNVRELEGFLKRLHAYVTLSHQSISMELIKNVVLEVKPESTSVPDVPPEPITSSSPPILASAMQAALPPQGHKAPLPPEPAPDVEPVKEVHVNGKEKKKIEEPLSAPVSAPAPVVVAPSAPPKPFAPPPPPTPPVQDPLPSVITDMPKIQRAVPDKPETPPPVEKKPDPPMRKPMVVPTVDDSIKEPIAPIPVVPVGATTEPDPFIEDSDPLPAGFKEINAVFFYPISGEKQMDTVHRKFQEVIKKHKLKFRLKKTYGHAYDHKTKLNYSSFVDVCKQNRVPVAIVIGPPPGGSISEQEFYDLLSVTLDVQGVSLQLVSWGEIEKDYRYLNLALDIALVRSR